MWRLPSMECLSKMTDLRQYTKKFLIEFIEVYKAHPALWQIRNSAYRDKAKKAAAYELLVNKCREVEPDCDKDTIVRKINSLRTCYRKEFKKVQRSLRAGAGEVYKPKLWYYDLLSFLNDDRDDETLSSGDSFYFLDEDATNDVSIGFLQINASLCSLYNTARTHLTIEESGTHEIRTPWVPLLPQ